MRGKLCSKISGFIYYKLTVCCGAAAADFFFNVNIREYGGCRVARSNVKKTITNGGIQWASGGRNRHLVKITENYRQLVDSNSFVQRM